MRFSRFETQDQSLFRDIGLTPGTPVVEMEIKKSDSMVFESKDGFKVYIYGANLRRLFNTVVDDKRRNE